MGNKLGQKGQKYCHFSDRLPFVAINWGKRVKNIAFWRFSMEDNKETSIRSDVN